jgi:hypothetical protein
MQRDAGGRRISPVQQLPTGLCARSQLAGSSPFRIHTIALLIDVQASLITAPEAVCSKCAASRKSWPAEAHNPHRELWPSAGSPRQIPVPVMGCFFRLLMHGGVQRFPCDPIRPCSVSCLFL